MSLFLHAPGNSPSTLAVFSHCIWNENTDMISVWRDQSCQCILSTVWKQTPQRQETGSTASPCPEIGTLGAGDEGMLGPSVEPETKQQSTVEFRLLPDSFEKACGSGVLFWDIDVLLYDLYGVFSCYSLVQIPLICTVGEALEKQQLHNCTILSTPRGAGA